MDKHHTGLILSLLVFAGCSASAQTWNGGGANNNWSTVANWTGGVPANPSPAAGTANVIFDGSIRPAPNIDVVWTIDTLTFNAGAGAFTIGGSQLTLENTTGLTGITDNSVNTETINAPLVLGVVTAAQTFTTAAGGTLVIGGAMDWAGSVLTVDGAGNTTFSGVGSDLAGGASLIKNGTGKLTMSNSNAYSAGTTVNAGVLNVQNGGALGGGVAGATTVAAGAALEIQGGIALQTGGLTINGTGIGGAGAIRNISGNNSCADLVTMNSASSIGSDAGTLTLSNVISDGGLVLNLTKVGAGTVTFSGAAANTYTGTTTVNDGTLQFNKTAGVNAIAGALTIGDGVGAANSATVQFLASNQMPNTTTPSILSDGLLNLNGFNQTVAGLNITGGNVSTGAGKLTLNGNVTGNASASTATISGNVNLNAATRTFTIAAGTASPDMSISAVISNGGITKAGAGVLVFSGNNTYAGLTTVSAGTLIAAANNALGTIAGTTTVSSGGTLGFQGGITYSTAEAVTINGTGAAGRSGAIDNVSGNNSFAGPITLATASTIGSSSGTMTLSGATVNAANLLTVSGAGNTTMTGVISGLGGLTKNGAGTLTLSGALPNTFTGATTVSAGTLTLSTAGALGSTSSVTLNSGGTLLLNGGNIDRINNAAGLVMAGGILSANEATETMGTMTLTANSTINLVSGIPAATLTFANTTWTPGANTLTINNWSGAVGSAGTDDRIFFGSTMGGQQLSGIQFTGFGSGAYVLGGGEVVPAPEPATLLAGVLMLLGMLQVWLAPRLRSGQVLSPPPAGGCATKILA